MFNHKHDESGSLFGCTECWKVFKAGRASKGVDPYWTANQLLEHKNRRLEEALSQANFRITILDQVLKQLHIEVKL